MKPAAIVLLCLFAVVSCSEPKDVIHPEERSITQSVYASGVIVSKDQYQVFATASGILERMLVSEGDSVTAGQIIAQVTNQIATLTRENATVASDYASVRNNEEKLDELRAAIQLAALKRADDSLMTLRQQRLLKQSVGSQIDVEQRELAAANSRTAHVNAILKYTQLAKQLRFASQQAKLNREISAVASDDLAVRSEVTGKVYSILKKRGEAISPQTPIALLGSDSAFIIELQVDEYDIASMRVGQIAYLTMDSYRDTVFRATITKIYPIMNARTKSFTVEAVFVEKPKKLFANLTVEANIVLQTKKNVLIIPRIYVTKDGYVKLSDGTTKKVVEGIRDYQMVEIMSGLSKSDALMKP
ncbi:MAG: efflux RND transporter periplasmic adaptor subunit [Candidatus Kapabacteria bacterium]|nr:efflux RND transporter periplasmic adaptor subunit [Candidatus Kapabacteria bacterium]